MMCVGAYASRLAINIATYVLNMDQAQKCVDCAAVEVYIFALVRECLAPEGL